MRSIDFIKRAVPSFIGLALLGTALGQGCVDGQVKDVCEAFCDCVKCNDRDEELCEIDGERGLDFAAAHACDAEAEAVGDCIISDGSCDEGQFQYVEDCADELMEYNECVEDSSDLDGGGSVNGNVAAPSANNGSPASGTPASSGSGTTGGTCTCNCGGTDIPTEVADCSQCQPGCEAADCTFVSCE